MPLTTSDVQQVLEQAIVEAKLGKPEQAPAFATALTRIVTDDLNEVLKNAAALAVPVPSPSPVPVLTMAPAALSSSLMSVADALLVRDQISTVIAGALAVGQGGAPKAAEALLLADYVNVGVILSDAERVDTSSTPRAVTGSHSTVTDGPYSSS